MNKIPAALHPIHILGVFAHPGERANSLYLLLSGTAQVIREGVDGTQQVLAHLNLGPSLGKRGWPIGKGTMTM
jgi:CRP-like cAMP-binding protein